MTENLEIIHEFSNEVRDLLEQLEPSILDLEKVCDGELAQDSAEISEALNNIFRLFHSIKGSAALLEFDDFVLQDKIVRGTFQQIQEQLF